MGKEQRVWRLYLIESPHLRNSNLKRDNWLFPPSSSKSWLFPPSSSKSYPISFLGNSNELDHLSLLCPSFLNFIPFLCYQNILLNSLTINAYGKTRAVVLKWWGGGLCSPNGTCQCLERVLVVTVQGREVSPTGIWWMAARDVAKHLILHKIASHKTKNNCTSQNSNSTKVEKLWLR